MATLYGFKSLPKRIYGDEGSITIGPGERFLLGCMFVIGRLFSFFMKTAPRKI